MVDIRADFGDDPDKLMSEDNSFFCAGNGSIFNMQVTGADGGTGDPKDSILWREDGRNRAFLQGKGSISLIDQSHHGLLCGHRNTSFKILVVL